MGQRVPASGARAGGHADTAAISALDVGELLRDLSVANSHHVNAAHVTGSPVEHPPDHRSVAGHDRLLAPEGIGRRACEELFPIRTNLGLASGLVGSVLGVVVGPALLAGPGPLSQVQLLSFATLGFWVWMLATGILLFRRTSPTD